MRHLVALGEVVDQALRVLGLVGHHPGEGALVVGVVGIEAPGNEVGVVVVLGEDDGLAQAVATGHLPAMGHQGGQHLVDRVLVEQPLVERLGIDLVGRVAVFAPFKLVPAGLVLVRQVGVADALALELQRHRDRHRRHQMAVRHRLVQAVGVGRHAVLQPEQAVGVVVDLVLGRRGQAHQQGVEVIEDGAVLLVDRAVRLVDDDEVEMPDAKAALAAGHVVDQAHHGRVGRDINPALGVLVGHQIHRGGIGQVLLEGVDRLVHQRHPVGQEQDALGPVAAHQHIGQRDHGAGLARSGGHHQQGAALAVHLEAVADPAHRTGLVMALDDRAVDDGLGRALAAAAALDGQLQLVLLVEALHRAWRVSLVVPQPVLVAVRVENQRALAVHPLQAVGVQSGLLLADAGAAGGALGLDQGQGLAVVAPEHIVHVALALAVGHAGDLDLEVDGRVQVPAGFLQQHVDEGLAGFSFGIVVRVRFGGVGLLRGGNFGLQLLELVRQGSLLLEGRGQLVVTLLQAGFELLQLLGGLGRHARRCGQQGRRKRQAG